jgi:hypothetical protein
MSSRRKSGRVKCGDIVDQRYFEITWYLKKHFNLPHG